MIRGLRFGVFGLFLLGCNGVIGGANPIANDPGGPTAAPGLPTGSPGVGAPSATTLPRMTKQQHQRSVSQLLVHFLGGDAQAVIDAVEPAYAIIPDDPSELDFGELVGSSFSRMSQNVTELHVRGYFDVAVTVANAIVQDNLRRQAIFGPCVDEPSDDHRDCVSEFVEDFGLWTARRPLSDEEQAFYVDTVFADDGRDYEATPEALGDLLVAMLSSPNFIYFVWDRGPEVESGVFELSPYELASRLSFHFWSAMPDEELFDAAADGSLLTEVGYRQQVERMYADPRADATFERFFYEWLALYKTGDPYGGVAGSDPQKLAFIEGTDVSPELRDHMIAEAVDMGEYYRAHGHFDDLFTSNLSFARTDDLAAIYGVPVWEEGADPVPFPTAERIGVLGRGALLTAATVYTHPILRGVRIRENFLCDELGDPPADVNGAPDAVSALTTTRERTEALTSPGGCNGCHQLINGLGFPLEAFDALGRHRTDEMIIDIEGAVTTIPLDLETTPLIEGATDTTVVSGPVELVDELLDSGKLQRCFATHYVRFALGFEADPAFGGDRGTVDALAYELEAGATLTEFFREIAFLPAFRQRARGDES